MPWLKVSDTLSWNPQIVAAGNAATGLWVRAGAWSMQQLTDGYVPAAIAKSMGSPAEIKQLVAVGLWIEEGDGYRFPDWLDEQPSSDKIKKDRAAAAERQKKARSRAAEANDQ